MIIELVAIVSLGAWMVTVDTSRLLQDRLSLGVMLCCAAVGAIQLIPLPSAWWTALPGRDLATAALAAANIVPSPHPLSLDPSATVQTLLAILPGLSVFLAARHADSRQIYQWLLIVVGAAIASIIIGVIQVSSGNFYFYNITHFGYPVGWFANRNHEGDFLLLALLISVGALQGIRRTSASAMQIICLIALFTICVVATASRSAITLLPIALFASAYIAFASRRTLSRPALAGISICVVLFVAFLSVTNGVLSGAFERFRDVSEDLRPVIWHNSWIAVGRFWPAGSGLGTFVDAYQAVEPLHAVSTYYINAAHNDYLQLTIELGIVAIPVFSIYGAAFTLCSLRSVRRSDPLGIACSAGILIVLLHSLTDYPLRTGGVLVTFGLMNAVLVNGARRQKVNLPAGHKRSIDG